MLGAKSERCAGDGLNDGARCGVGRDAVHDALHIVEAAHGR